MQKKVHALVDNIEQVIVGKRLQVIKVALAVLCKGHILIEDVPGTGKTQLVLSLSKSVSGVFHRIQMTPDIMPSDIVGFTMIDPVTKEMIYKEGCAMCNFLLADEINRCSPKVQSSLLEVMEERQISMDGKTYRLPQPFIVFATQNPVENYGTFHLPDAQMDRFLLKLSMGYPSTEQELELLERHSLNDHMPEIHPVLSLNDIRDLQAQAAAVTVNKEVREYILRIVQVTRTDEHIHLGISPRGSISLANAAKGLAFISERDYVIPDDVKAIATDVLSHRLILSQKGKMQYKNAASYMNTLLNKINTAGS